MDNWTVNDWVPLAIAAAFFIGAIAGYLVRKFRHRCPEPQQLAADYAQRNRGVQAMYARLEKAREQGNQAIVERQLARLRAAGQTDAMIDGYFKR